MTNRKYILNEQGEPVLEPDLSKWGEWFENNFHNRRVARTEIGNYTVSTVFLGLDHNWDDGPPVLWESMLFGPANKNGLMDSLEMERCSGSREQAEALHMTMVEKIKTLLALEDRIDSNC